MVSYKCQTGTATETVNCADRTCIQNGEKGADLYTRLHKERNVTMKKLFAAMTAAAMALSLAACGSSASSTPAQSEAASKKEQLAKRKAAN